MAAQHFNQESDLIAALKAYTQADADGVMVKVSRQACDEAAERIAALEADLAAANTRADLMLRVAQKHEAEAAALRVDAERWRGVMLNIMQTACDADEAPAQDLLRQILDVCVLHVQKVKGNDAAIDAAKETGNG